MMGQCPYVCNNKTGFGYCNTTACINPKYQSSSTGEETTTLKECPFCGTDNVRVQSIFSEYIRGYNISFYLECGECHAKTGNYKNRHEAVEAWNHRCGLPAL